MIKYTIRQKLHSREWTSADHRQISRISMSTTSSRGDRLRIQSNHEITPCCVDCGDRGEPRYRSSLAIFFSPFTFSKPLRALRLTPTYHQVSSKAYSKAITASSHSLTICLLSSLRRGRSVCGVLKAPPSFHTITHPPRLSYPSRPQTHIPSLLGTSPNTASTPRGRPSAVNPVVLIQAALIFVSILDGQGPLIGRVPKKETNSLGVQVMQLFGP